ncbi:MAG: TIM barrel protein [Elusimicrobia bacterium]|nr:TIM barrel protein [Candidatus Obscuribacterium magneticum]
MNEIKFAISTTAFPNKTVAEIEKLALDNSLPIEFSSSFQHEPHLEDKFLGIRCKRYIHNYFPPPETPFVLNLASLDQAVWEKSVGHGKQGLNLTRLIGSPFYSIHAGFCANPAPQELGNKFNSSTSPDNRMDHWNAFVKAIKILLMEAERHKVKLLIENNLLIKENLSSSGTYPLLFIDADEIITLFKELSHPLLGLLLDTAHVKISSLTRGKDPHLFVEKVADRVVAIHHSDNDGLRDNNQTLSNDYWFLPHMNRFRQAFHVLEVGPSTPEDLRRQIGLLKKAMEK